ncbi:MAG: hypothetical protein Q9227_003696 [Pyrenula ochraceoflavens]
MFWLVESREGPVNDEQMFRMELKENETFERDFIGASVQDCQKWALEKQYQHKFIHQDCITIVDARSIMDNTVLSCYFNHKMEEPLRFGKYGPLPREEDTWYNFRVDHERAADINIEFYFGPFDGVYPLFFGLKEELTDKYGVFDVDKAIRVLEGEEDQHLLEF